MILLIAILLFILAAIFGLVLITKVFQNSPRPIGAIIAHGLIAAAGLVLVFICVLRNYEKSPVASFILFLVAALGGFIMFGRDMSKKPIPKGLALIHAGAAAVGLLLLILFVI